MLPTPDEFTMLVLDPPNQERLRALVTRAFTRRAVAALDTPHPECPRRGLGRHGRPLGLRPHAGGGPAAAGDRHRRDAGRAARGPGAIQALVGVARASAGAHHRGARAAPRRRGQQRRFPTIIAKDADENYLATC